MRITASKLDRIARCPASAALPQSPDTGGVWATRGTALHTFCERAGEVGRETALEETPDEHRAAAAALSEHSYSGDGVFEIAFAYDPVADTARELGRGKGRHYGDAVDGEICGAADFVALTPDGGVYVRDLKTGRGWQPPLAEHWQLRMYGLAAARAFDRQSVTIELCRDLGDGGLSVGRLELDLFDLAAFAAEVRELTERIPHQHAELDPVEGEWCKYCPAFEACPRKLQLAKALAAPEQPPLSVVIDEHSFADVWRKVKTARDVLSRIERGLDAYVEMCGSVSLGDGVSVTSVEKSRESVIAPVVASLLETMWDHETAESAVDTVQKASKASIKRALRGLKESGKLTCSLAAAEREIFAELRSMGGVKTSTFRKIEEVLDPKPEEIDP